MCSPRDMGRSRVKKVIFFGFEPGRYGGNMPVLTVKTFGEFSISCNGKSINSKQDRSKKIWLFLTYIIVHHRDTIPEAQILKLLWPEAEEKDASVQGSLKTLLHRTRILLEELSLGEDANPIVKRKSSIAWNPEFELRIDCEMFDERMNRIKESSGDDPGLVNYQLDTLRMYKGMFLPDNALDIWALPLISHYRSEYNTLLRKTVVTLCRLGRYPEVLELCRNAAEHNEFDEFINYHIIYALAYMDQKPAALKHYQNYVDMLYSELSINPSRQLLELYRHVLKSSSVSSVSVESIVEDVLDMNEERAAYSCDYQFFRILCQVQMRLAMRFKIPMYLCVLSISSEGKRLTPYQREEAMLALAKAISGSLRCSDAFTVYSDYQYLILLPGMTDANGSLVENRIIGSFYRNNPGMDIVINPTIVPLKLSPKEKRNIDNTDI